MILLTLFIILQSDTLQKLYDSGNYFAVIEQAETAIKDTNLTLEDRTGIHTILAFCYVAFDKPRLAKLEFLEALTINPKLELDPMLTSPKIIKVFQEAKSNFRFFMREKQEVQKIKKDFTAFTIPGIWNIKRGNKKRGYCLLGWSGTSVLSLGISHYQCEKYHKEYLDARIPELIEAKYKNYNRWYQSRIYSLVSFAATYTVNLFLLALSP